jgi:(E)-4-hydroxy-3-methylbut-2-enyl-diphosphate synthase
VRYDGIPADMVTIRAAADMGTLLMNGLRDGIFIESDAMSTADIARLSLGILQAARQRFTRTEYIACPGCGRTLFDLQGTLAQVKAATSHLKGLKIGVMGCIVNGPGEMADADYGYVGAAAGHVSLYKGKECVAKNLTAQEALPRLIQLIKDSGDWVEPAS